jgi:hypothetical protein
MYQGVLVGSLVYVWWQVFADNLRPRNMLLRLLRGFFVTIKGGRYVSRCLGWFIGLFLVTGLCRQFKTTECVVKSCERFACHYKGWTLHMLSVHSKFNIETTIAKYVSPDHCRPLQTAPKQLWNSEYWMNSISVTCKPWICFLYIQDKSSNSQNSTLKSQLPNMSIRTLANRTKTVIRLWILDESDFCHL